MWGPGFGPHNAHSDPQGCVFLENGIKNLSTNTHIKTCSDYFYPLRLDTMNRCWRHWSGIFVYSTSVSATVLLLVFHQNLCSSINSENPANEPHPWLQRRRFKVWWRPRAARLPSPIAPSCARWERPVTGVIHLVFTLFSHCCALPQSVKRLTLTISRLRKTPLKHPEFQVFVSAKYFMGVCVSSPHQRQNCGCLVEGRNRSQPGSFSFHFRSSNILSQRQKTWSLQEVYYQ